MIITFVVLVFVSLTPAAPTHNHVCPTQKSDTPSTNHTKFIWFPEHPSHARLGSRETKNRNRKMLFLPWSFASRKRFFYFHLNCVVMFGAFVCRNTFHHKMGRSTGVEVWEAGCMKGDKWIPWTRRDVTLCCGDILSLARKLQFQGVCVEGRINSLVCEYAAGAEASRTHRDGKHCHDLPFSICWFPPNVDFRLSFPITLVTRARNFVNRVWNPNSIRRCHEHLNLQSIPALAGGWLWGR